MLVLSRKCGEQIVIDENVWVSILEVRRDRVKLGFTAPREVSIQRDEIYAQEESRLLSCAEAK